MGDKTEDAAAASTKDRLQDEYREKSPEEIKALKRYLDSRDISTDFVRPYFEKALRFENLYNGVLPEELDCTFSKCMLPTAFSMVQNDIPRLVSSVLGTDAFAQLYANAPEWEYPAEAATQWLLYMARKRNRIFPRIIPTLQRQSIVGTGYRTVTHNIQTKTRTRRAPSGRFGGIPYGYREESSETKELQIISQNIDFWNILPAPNGGMVNVWDNEAEEAVEWLHWIQYKTRAWLERLKKNKFADARAIDRLLTSPMDKNSGGEIDGEFRQRVSDDSIGVETPDWISRIRTDQKAVESRWRCVWTFFRDQWMLVGEHKHILYLGPPLLDWFPVAKYVDTPNMGDWFGRGLIEVCEDVILSYLLTHNFRMDYLVTTLHPTKFVRSDLVKDNTGDLNDFDPTPFGIFKFNKRIRDIQKAIWYDRFPEISPQAFMEDSNFKQLLQEATGQPNYMKGMGGSGTLANETATGIISLIEEGTARSSMRALMTEYGGLHDELMLMLKLGKKYVWEDQAVEITDSTGKHSWRMIPHERIDDGYGIELKGTRGLVNKNEMVKRMMSVLPMILGNPSIPGQKEVLRQTLEKVGGFVNLEAILGESVDGGGTLGPVAQGAQPGGGTPTLQNEGQAVARAMPEARNRSEARFVGA